MKIQNLRSLLGVGSFEKIQLVEHIKITGCHPSLLFFACRSKEAKVWKMKRYNQQDLHLLVFALGHGSPKQHPF